MAENLSKYARRKAERMHGKPMASRPRPPWWITRWMWDPATNPVTNGPWKTIARGRLEELR